jgi:hypothetical protein
MAVLELPRPARAAAPFILIGALVLGFAAAPNLPWVLVAGAAALFELAGIARALVARRELAELRRAADRLILQAPRYPDAIALVRWRSRELTATAERVRVRREVDRVLRALDPGRLPSASPLRRPAARRNRELLELLSTRLADSRPVTARGVLLAQGLLRDDASPLYNDGSDLLLPRALTRVLSALEP